MKKKVVSALLCATMVATMFAGCGSKESDNNASTPDTSKADTSSEVSEPAEDTGKVLNIYCWNEEFKSRITAHYPDYLPCILQQCNIQVGRRKQDQH